jgi:hypothetical protein
MSQPTTTISEANSPNQTTDNNNSQDLVEDLPKDLPAAIDKIKQLSLKRDELLHQKAKTDKELEWMTRNVRLAQIKTLVPRVLYRNSDDYENEINKVYSWQGMSDSDIAEIYQNKLRAIDLGQGKRTPKQHGSSTMMQQERSDSYAGFRSVPEFNNIASAAAKINQASSDNAKLFGLMKKIARANNNSNNN